ncbi:hypothetical protein LSH36_23g08088 [Paralvinella palmiformis]|uniref:Kazal-like domain-containing protein n=1 Tax=Paralvinella palmiformis TaxID=53620 RepID=A0AAD9NF10_9ANNE|nr:hypothetical protein LSH36_23g08088 [Paralvinella palmiformis]
MSGYISANCPNIVRKIEVNMKILIVFVWILVVQAVTEATPSGVLRCDVIHIIRDWPESKSDGFYNITDQSCNAGYPDLYYKKATAPERYFYRLTNGYWMLYVNECDINHIGVTNQSTSKPWTTEFVDVGNATTSISCVRYTETIVHPSTIPRETWSLPEFKPLQPYVYYNLTVELPDKTETVDVYIDPKNGLCENGNISLYWRSGDEPFTLVTIQCFDHLPESVLVKYPLTEAKKWFQLLVNYQRPDNLTVGPNLDLTYSVYVTQFPDEDDPDTTPYLSYSDSDGSGEPLFDHDLTTILTPDNTTDGYVDPDAGSPPTENKGNVSSDPCDGITCYGGLRCKDGKCPCPTRQQCSDHHTFHPVCANNGHTYANLCYIRAERCGFGKQLFVVSRGPCPPTSHGNSYHSPSSTEETVTDPEIGAVTEEKDWTALIIGITIACVIVLALAVLIAIICSRKRAIRQKRPPASDKEKGFTAPTNKVYGHKSQPANNARRSRPFSRSSNTSFRASPKSQPRLTIDIKPNNEVDPDRFSLSGCITPLCDDPENLVSTFTSPQTKPNGNNPDVHTNGSIPRKDRPLSMTDNSISELNPETDAGIQTPADPTPDSMDKPDNKRRSNPPQRHSSATESKVYEVEVEPGIVLDFNALSGVDKAFDDSHLTTRL